MDIDRPRGLGDLSKQVDKVSTSFGIFDKFSIRLSLLVAQGGVFRGHKGSSASRPNVVSTSGTEIEVRNRKNTVHFGTKRKG